MIFQEPGEGSLSSQLSRFWNGWRELSNTPESTTARATLLTDAEALVTQIQRSYEGLRGVQRNVDSQVGAVAAQVNGLADAIAKLNDQIVQIEGAGGNAGDLRDRRDLRLDDLAQLANVEIRERQGGAVSVVLGGREIVSGAAVERLITTVNPANLNYLDVRFASDNGLVTLTSGELFGLVTARDVGLAQPIADLNTLAGALITQVNAVHSAAFGLDNTTGEAFFTGTDAATIGVNTVLTANANKIGGGGGGEPAGRCQSGAGDRQSGERAGDEWRRHHDGRVFTRARSARWAWRSWMPGLRRKARSTWRSICARCGSRWRG